MKKIILKITAAVIAAAMAVAGCQKAVAEDTVTVLAAESVSQKQTGKLYYVTAEVLNIRSGPGTDYSVIGSLTKGMRVKVFSIRGEQGNRWAKIRFAGLTAYASAKHLAKNR